VGKDTGNNEEKMTASSWRKIQTI